MSSTTRHKTVPESLPTKPPAPKFATPTYASPRVRFILKKVIEYCCLFILLPGFALWFLWLMN